MLLDHLGFARQHVRLQVYPHHFESSGDVVEWVKGTNLTRFESRLTPETSTPSSSTATARDSSTSLGDQRPYLYTFKRILFWARR